MSYTYYRANVMCHNCCGPHYIRNCPAIVCPICHDNHMKKKCPWYDPNYKKRFTPMPEKNTEMDDIANLVINIFGVDGKKEIETGKNIPLSFSTKKWE